MSYIPKDLRSAIELANVDSESFTEAIDVVVSTEYPYNDIYKLLKNDEARTYYDVVYTSFLSSREENKRREEEAKQRKEEVRKEEVRKEELRKEEMMYRRYENIELLGDFYGYDNVWYNEVEVLPNVPGDGKCLLYSMLLDLASTNSVNTICNFDDIESMNDLLTLIHSTINSKLFFDCVINYANNIDGVVAKCVFVDDILTTLKPSIDDNTLFNCSNDLRQFIYETVFADFESNFDLDFDDEYYSKIMYVISHLHEVELNIVKLDLLNPLFADMFCYTTVVRSFEDDYLSQQLKLDIVYQFLFNKVKINYIHEHRNFHAIQNVAKKIAGYNNVSYTINPFGYEKTFVGSRILNSVLFGAHYRTVFTIEQFNDRCNNHCFKKLIRIFNEYFQEKENQDIDGASLALIRSFSS